MAMNDDLNTESKKSTLPPHMQAHHPLCGSKKLIRPVYWLAWRLDNPHRVLFVCMMGLTCFVLLMPSLGWKKASLISWIISIGSYLLLVALVAIDADETATKKRVRHEPQALTILLSIVVATLLSNICFAIILNLIKPTGAGRDHFMIALCAMAILLSWLLLHTGFGRYYCQVFYATKDHLGQPALGGVRGGFTFHGTPEPSQLDFFYLAFMIGLTYSSSDVNITNRHARKLVLLHSLVSFIFYSTIVTSIVNVAIFSS
jgi:uncharacterized membrane protein